MIKISMLNQNEVKVCDEGSKEKLTIEVEFDADRSSTDKGDYGKTSSSIKSLFNCQRQKETKVHTAQQRYEFESMVRFALLRHPIVEIHYLTMMV